MLESENTLYSKDPSDGNITAWMVQKDYDNSPSYQDEYYEGGEDDGKGSNTDRDEQTFEG